MYENIQRRYVSTGQGADPGSSGHLIVAASPSLIIALLTLFGLHRTNEILVEY
jgi:hypothetical protein